MSWIIIIFVVSICPKASDICCVFAPQTSLAQDNECSEKIGSTFIGEVNCRRKKSDFVPSRLSLAAAFVVLVVRVLWIHTWCRLETSREREREREIVRETNSNRELCCGTLSFPIIFKGKHEHWTSPNHHHQINNQFNITNRTKYEHSQH